MLTIVLARTASFTGGPVVVVETLTPLGIGIVVVAGAQEPAAAPRSPHAPPVSCERVLSPDPQAIFART